MSPPLRTAIMLAAGVGRRLGALADGRPKALLRFGTQTIVEESMGHLRDAGITRLVVGTGYGAEFLTPLSPPEGLRVEWRYNARFASSGSMSTLVVAAESIDEDVLLVESDLVYEPRAIRVLQECASTSAVLVSGFTNAGDEVFVEAGAQRELRALSKHRQQLGEGVLGEFVGLTRLSAAVLRDMIARAEHADHTEHAIEYEQMLAASAAVHPVSCLLVADLLWGEIDDETHYARVASAVYPALKAVSPPAR